MSTLDGLGILLADLPVYFANGLLVIGYTSRRQFAGACQPGLCLWLLALVRPAYAGKSQALCPGAAEYG